MSRYSIEARVREVIVEHLAIDESRVTSSASLAVELGADDIDILEIVMVLEEAFGIEISDRDVEGLETVDDIVSCIQRELAS